MNWEDGATASRDSFRQRQHINRAAAVVVAAQQLFRFQVVDVFVHRGERAEAHRRADFLEGRRVAVALDEFRDEVVHLSLPLSQSHGQPFVHPQSPHILANKKRSVK